MNPDDALVDEETRISEITILPDGRICVFGMSPQVLEVLDHLNFGDAALRQRIDHLGVLKADDSNPPGGGEGRVCRAPSAGPNDSGQGGLEP